MKRPGYVVEAFDLVATGYGNLMDEDKTATQSIKEFCLECQGGHRLPWRDGRGGVAPPLLPHEEVRECRSYSCWLYPYRSGHNPHKAHFKGNTTALRKHRRGS